MANTISEQQRLALKMAAQWFATLCAGEVTPQQHARWQQWLQQHDDHRWAWQRVESLQGQLKSMPGHFGYQTLNHSHQQARLTRRRVLKTLLVLLGVGSSWQLWQSPVGSRLRADYTTGTGQFRSVKLEDGSQLSLNTASAVTVHFTPQQRLIRLEQGEIAIATAKDPQRSRPFLVQTSQGIVRALGTEFTVRERGNITELAVQEQAVEVTLSGKPGLTQRVEQGKILRFTDREFEPITPLDPNSNAWTRGILSVSNRRLSEVIEEIARYRHGVLTCDSSVADLRVTGTFPLADTDKLLHLLTRTLPIKIQSATRYWLKVTAA